MKKTALMSLLLFIVFIISCGGSTTLSPAADNPNAVFQGRAAAYERMLAGQASVADLRYAVDNYDRLPAGPETNNQDAVIAMPQTGSLFVTLHDNDAGWRSELYMTVGDDTYLLFEDTRQGPLHKTTEYVYRAGTEVGFTLVTYVPGGEVLTNNAYDGLCNIDYIEAENKWILYFEDNPGGDEDYNDAVIEVQMAADSFIDLSDKLEVSLAYLDHHGYTDEGYVIYYIGETMNYEVHIKVVEDDILFTDNTFMVYAVHEYYEDITCDRWWYQPPARDPDEPQIITVAKGDPLPDQDPPQLWQNVVFNEGEENVLSASYNGGLAVAAGNDQTHVIIIRENEDDQVELVVYDNPEAGVFDPPPAP
ncbi:MAG TPA: hypothetical protein VKS21_00425 [Spirochaetota bacterium]|nr:hypothetical protein [Spirochaetota bacterium]